MNIRRHKELHTLGLGKRAFTVVELLIVMAIIVILAAVTLPSLRGLLAGQKVSEASRIVSNYLEAGKSRSAATGRPVAVILERTGNPSSDSLIALNSCTRLAIGDVFPPYTGDWANTVGILESSVGDNVVDSIRIPAPQVASLTGIFGSPLVNVGDVIELGERRERFTLTALPEAQNTDIVLQFANRPLATFRESAPLAVGSRSEFRIYRRPSKSMVGGVNLPRGTCIDLHFSGSGPNGREFSTDAIANSQSLVYTSVLFVFQPDGSVRSWYVNGAESPIPGLVHLLVGETDQVIERTLNDDGSVNTDGVTAALTASETFTSNLRDTGNSWITLNPFNGAVAVSPVQESDQVVGAGGSLGLVLERSRQFATYGVPETIQ